MMRENGKMRAKDSRQNKLTILFAALEGSRSSSRHGMWRV